MTTIHSAAVQSRTALGGRVLRTLCNALIFRRVSPLTLAPVFASNQLLDRRPRLRLPLYRKLNGPYEPTVHALPSAIRVLDWSFSVIADDMPNTWKGFMNRVELFSQEPEVDIRSAIRQDQPLADVTIHLADADTIEIEYPTPIA